MVVWLSLQIILRSFHSPVAQSAEQVAVNHRVGGSNPSRGANFKPFHENPFHE